MTDQLRRAGTSSTSLVERRLLGEGGAPGPMAAWAQALRYVARFLRDSGSPAFLIWGTEGRLLYNDACLQRLAQHHPQALGQPVAQAWPALWKAVPRPGQLTP